MEIVPWKVFFVWHQLLYLTACAYNDLISYLDLFCSFETISYAKTFKFDTNVVVNVAFGIRSGAGVTNAQKLLSKSFKQKAWLWLADAKAPANHSHALC